MLGIGEYLFLLLLSVLGKEGHCQKEDFLCYSNYAYFSSDDDAQDKSSVMKDNSYSIDEDVPADVQRLRDVVETMTDKQKQVYTLHVLQGYSFTEISKMIQTSVPNVTKHFEKAKDHIRKNF